MRIHSWNHTYARVVAHELGMSCSAKNNLSLSRREGFRGAFGPCLKASMEDFTLVSRSFLLKPYRTICVK